MSTWIVRCKGCEHWQPFKSKTEGICSLVRIEGEVPEWTAAIDVFAGDDQVVEVEFWTRPEFGCTQFQRKE